MLCHTAPYLNYIKEAVLDCARKKLSDGSYMLATGDTQISPDSLKVARLAVGSVLNGVDHVMKGIAKNVFCIVRPPGHHANQKCGMGFCIFNNVAIGARYAQINYSDVKRVLIVDWDVHHGNGTEDIFIEDPSVFYFSTHQEGLYPGTGSSHDIGKGKGQGTILNCPIPPGADARLKVLEAFQVKLVQAMEIFKPNFVFISAGFDSREGDPLGGFNLTDADFMTLTQIVKDIADKYAKGRIVSVLEGI